ncbi:hypothetical protein CRD60_04575 [Bifidobacterium aemilianum]|uniref:Uncharacterized protein n=2 Tax=Bifidobacterium aemilianum TaxID=2493120 RepID=A0A366K800_9BIFI|nr:hypothetical protein CRD60_04575 [Bifidobacterium aemilianum]
MSQMDPEDSMDQMMVQTWQNVAQSLRMLHGALRSDFQSGARARRMTRNEHARERQMLQRRLEEWEAANRIKLNDGFEQTIKATVLNPAVKAQPDLLGDAELLKSWCITDHLEEYDPAFTRDNRRARQWLKEEWARRGHRTNIDAEADQIVNHVTVTVAAQSPELDQTLATFRKAGVPVTVQEAPDPEEFRRKHHGEDFQVQTRRNGDWDGYNREKLTEAVLTSPIDSVDAAAGRISFLKEEGLPESSGAGNRSVGDEPSTISEVERPEIGSAPVPDQATDAEQDRGGGDLKTAGDPLPNQDDLFELEAQESWAGPDMFGQYSAGEELALSSVTDLQKADMGLTQDPGRRIGRRE